MPYYKVLVQGRSCHGGDCEYSLPTQSDDGTWEPGEWMPEISGPLEPCGNGYHLTREPARWWREGAECYEAEWDGDYIADDYDTIVVRRCQLLRRLTTAELAALQVFVEGSHLVSDGIAAASGSARVWARGSAQVWAFESARVEASDSARIFARGSARVEARDSAQISAYDSAQVWARDSVRVWARDSTRIWANDAAQVWAYDAARVEARDSSVVRTACGQPTVRLFAESAWLDYRGDVAVVHTAAGSRELVANGG